MKRRELLISSAAALALSQLPLRWVAAAEKQRKLLFFTKSSGFEHSSIHRDGDKLSHAETVVTELGKQHGFDVVATKDGTVFDGDLDQYDAFLFYTTGDLTTSGTDKQPPMSTAGKQRLFDTVAAGKGFMACHSGADTFHSPGHDAGKQRETQAEVDPYIAMLGGEFISHGPQQVAHQVVADAKFPGLEGIAEGDSKSFAVNDEWYSLKNYAGDLHVILAMDTQGMKGKDYERPAFPCTWARRHGKGRVFYTSMGHREDVWTNPKFQQILLGGFAWAAGDKDADVTPNMKQVTPGAGVMPPK